MFPLCLSSPPSCLIHLPPQKPLQTLTLIPSSLSSNFLPKHFLTHPTPSTFSLLRSSPESPPIFIEEIIEKDWSFLDLDSVNSDEDRRRKTRRSIFAAGIREGCRVLVCTGSEWFVDRLMELETSFELVLIIHESLLALAMIKEKYDKVRCWQGEIGDLPERFSRFDAVFVCYFPGMGLALDQLLGSVGSRCCYGARLIISFEQGREVIEASHRQLYPDMVTSELPEKSCLEEAAASHLFQVIEFVDEPTFYLAVLTFTGSEVSAQ